MAFEDDNIDLGCKHARRLQRPRRVLSKVVRRFSSFFLYIPRGGSSARRTGLLDASSVPVREVPQSAGSGSDRVLVGVILNIRIE